ncbi:hypothetical protein FNV43_RR08099 [Rhamnella rubrinervis]|uniref:Disease resistance R13L4/SHOC-2-like LRR domain-containing protein n=1 Tax=Rhamnella rubrinervis TaxID=2594499 RepID=A0A8K0MNB9_9ROSA|nr:hypothetical protein FNV43_RR08099 [Rhamnella rubrinervis]
MTTLERVLEAMHAELVDLQYMLFLDDVHYVWPKIQRDIHRLFPVNWTNRSTVVFTTCDADFSLPQPQPTPLLNMSLGDETDTGFHEFLQRALGKANATLEKYITEECIMRQIIQESTEARWPQLRTLARLCVTNISAYLKVLSELKDLSLKSLISWDWQYHMLPPRIRHCYLYMALFPEAFQIPIRRLLRLWVAEELVVKSDLPSTKTLEDVELSDVMLLQTRKMIQVEEKNGRPKTCWIPKDKYKFFSWKAKDLGFFYVHSDSSSRPKFNVRRLAAHVDIIKDYPTSDPYYIQHLRSYINVTRTRDTPAVQVGDFLDKYIKHIAEQRFGLLRVLDLEEVYKPLLKDETLGKLVLLTYLGLSWTFLDSLLDSIGALQHLETLDVKHTNITSLPSSIWKVKKLRRLLLRWAFLDSLPDSIDLSNSVVAKWLTKLSNLQKLDLTYHHSTAEQIANLVKDLRGLHSLGLRSLNEFGEPSGLMLPDMTEHINLSDLYLVGALKKLPNSPHNAEFQFPPNLKSLTLTGSQLQGSDMRLLGNLEQLNTLRLYGQSFFGDEIIFYDKAFPKLVVLKLWVLEELKRLGMDVGSLPSLEELDI